MQKTGIIFKRTKENLMELSNDTFKQTSQGLIRNLLVTSYKDPTGGESEATIKEL